MNDLQPTGSFITKNGDLDVRLTKGDVSWFDVLYFSRAMPAERRGWNNRSYWIERGLRVLVIESAQDFIKEWTINSMRKANPYLPPPRKLAFKFGNDPSRRSRDHLELELKADNPVESASENALNYALFNNRFEKIEKVEGIYPKGYEVPLVDGAEGQLKVDLFGVSGEAIQIVELKNARNTTDSPLLALIEAICYGMQTLRCSDSLLEAEGLGADKDTFRRIDITLVAPNSYWAYWSVPDLEELRKTCEPLIDRINAGIDEAGVKSRIKLEILPLKAK